jgi:hypothetical protein
MEKVESNFESKETPFTLRRKRNIQLEIAERCEKYLTGHATWPLRQKQELEKITGTLTFSAVQKTRDESTEAAERLFQRLQRLT